MLYIKLVIDKKKDEKNWQRVINKPAPFGLVIKHNARNVNNKRMKEYSRKEMDSLKKTKLILQKFIKHNKKNIIRAIESVTQKPLYSHNFIAAFTSAGLKPYYFKDNWFMISASKNTKLQMTEILHELLHLQTIYYYHDYCLKKGLTESQFNKLNEALTFLNNDQIFTKVGIIKDKGYPANDTIRKKLIKIWTSHRNFRKLIDKGIQLIK